jgi:hypothetical protein
MGEGNLAGVDLDLKGGKRMVGSTWVPELATVSIALLVAMVMATPLMAHEGAHESGPAYTEGEVLLGTIDFPTSAGAEAQDAFVRGVLYLHSFEYAPAAVAFREAQAIAPDFAMAYWGEAMTQHHSLRRGLENGPH